MPTVYGRNNFVWDGLTLRVGKRGKVVAQVVPDPDFQRMYRVRLPDGHLSDMCNLTRAKDAALSLAAAAIDKREAA
jgi:hypothetical protein